MLLWLSNSHLRLSRLRFYVYFNSSQQQWLNKKTFRAKPLFPSSACDKRPSDAFLLLLLLLFVSQRPMICHSHLNSLQKETTFKRHHFPSPFDRQTNLWFEISHYDKIPLLLSCIYLTQFSLSDRSNSNASVHQMCCHLAYNHGKPDLMRKTNIV